ncbi:MULTISPECIES: protein kinase [unclassified Streptomyces]|uniref:protein kinase domain-containing protein n=1 Tax=unclassified Streptomyces TaxID=2593676 RepID=UPI00381586FE
MSDLGRLVAGRYRLVERIGRGGMGTVWRAEDELLGRPVAVKKLHPPQPHLQDDELETLFERTRREARSAARISHPNVVVVHDVVEDEGLPSIVMEYVPATTLGDRLKERGPVAPEEAARIGRGMIAALRAAHAAGVLHRDVKPGNVLLSDTGRVVLTDFGIAQASGTSTLTRTGELIGSIDFLAPERLTGGTPGPEADLWALGATLFQAVEGRSPFRRDTAIETAYAIATDEVPVTGRAGPLGPVIAGLLVREPERRLPAQEAERMLRGLAAETATASVPRDVLSHPQQPLTGPTAVVRPPAGPVTAPVTAMPQAPAPAQAPPPVRRRRAPLWITAAVLVAVLAGGGAYAAQHFGGVDDTGAGPTGPSSQASSSTPSAPTSPPASQPPSYSPSPVPVGYHMVDEPDRGFSVPIPDGWTRQVSDDGQQIIYVDPTELVGLRIGTLDFAGPSPLQHFKDEEAQTIPKLDGYEQLRMQSTQWRGRPAAVWEFTFEGKARTFRAIDLGFGDPGQREFAVYLSAPAAQWASDRRVFENVVAGLVLHD